MFDRAALRISLLALAMTAGVMGAASVQAATVELISRADPSPDSNGRAGLPAMSADGRYVAFLSDAPNLVPGQVDENFFHDVFLHDRVTGSTTLVSHAVGSPSLASRAMGFYFLLDVQISADGRYVAFTSLGINLVAGVTDDNEESDVFLYDRVTGTTTLVSHAAGLPNVPANGISYGVQLSADGKYLAFTSRAKNLAAGQDEPGTGPFDDFADVFLWERTSNTVTLASRKNGTAATVANDDSSAAGISADGSVLLFTSQAADLLPNGSDTAESSDLFLYERSSRTVSLVSRVNGSPQTAAGAAGNILGFNNDFVYPVLSADGRYVAFASRASNLIPGQLDTGDSLDAFLFDRASGQMRLVSRTSDSPQRAGGLRPEGTRRLTAGGLSGAYDGLAMSADGRYVAFVSGAASLVPGQVDAGPSDDVFVYDRVTGTTALASHTRGSTVTAGSAGAGRPSFSADGRFLAFKSASADLVPNQTDANSRDDVFLYDRSTQATVLVSRPRGSAITAANGDSTAPRISADGAVVGFLSTATDLAEGQIDPNSFYDLFLYHRTSAEITNPSRRDPGLPAVTPEGPSTVESISADGRYVLFQSRATGLVPGQIDTPDGTVNSSGQPASTWDVFLRDTVAGKTTLLSRSRTSKLTAVSGETPALSADGRFAAFTSYEETTNGINRVYPLFLYDREADTLTLVNHSPGSPDTEGYPSHSSLSADGRYLAYECGGCSLVPGHPRASKREIFLHDRVSGLNTLVSHASTSPAAEANATSSCPRISADGRAVLFASLATDLVPGQIDVHGTLDLFVFDRTTGAVALVTHTAASAVTAARHFIDADRDASLSPDGRFIAFRSYAADLVPGQVNAADSGSNVFLYDRATGTTALVSHAASAPVTAANEISYLGGANAWSADSRFLVYGSAATDLVAGVTDTNDVPDIFLYDRLSGTSTLVSHAGAAPGRTTDTGATEAGISADGNRIAFYSSSSHLVPGQTVPTNSVNLFIRDRSAGTTALAGRMFRADSPLDPDDTLGPLSFSPALSADGRRVAFTTDAAFVQGDLNVNWDVYLWKDDGGGTPGGPIPLPTCKLLDTRRRADRPALTSNVQRTVTVRGACGVPATAKQVVVKVTALAASGKGNLRFYPGAVTATPSGILRFERNATRTETFTLPLSTNGTLTILPFVASRGTVHGVVEVTGYSN